MRYGKQAETIAVWLREASAKRELLAWNVIEEAADVIDALRAELTAARTVADGEVEDLVARLSGINFSSNPDDYDRATKAAADLLVRLSAAKAEAERERDKLQEQSNTWQGAAEMRETQLDDLANQHRAQIEALEKEYRRDIIKLGGERDEALAALAQAREALERIANHPNANALILTGKPMIGVGTLARDVLATPTRILSALTAEPPRP